MKQAVQEERRQFPRSDVIRAFNVSLVQAERSIPVESMNVSEGGVCLRLEEVLEVRSLVRLHLTPARERSAASAHALECAGRVAWVMQRLDLRTMPPFVFDVGIELLNPPSQIRTLVGTRPEQGGASRAVPRENKALSPSMLKGRQFIPRLARTTTEAPWHLVVSVDGIPCFSAHYPSERAALEAWTRFKREQAKR